MDAKASGRRPIKATRHPSRDSAIAVARPTPEPAPVMTAERRGEDVGELMNGGNDGTSGLVFQPRNSEHIEVEARGTRAGTGVTVPTHSRSGCSDPSVVAASVSGFQQKVAATSERCGDCRRSTEMRETAIWRALREPEWPRRGPGPRVPAEL